jgi:hypothetical protein
MWLWKDILTGCNVVLHTDKDGVRDSFIACHTTSSNALPILDACIRLEFESAWNTWMTRVPIESNTAADPSRFVVEHLIQGGCARDSVDPLSVWQVLMEMGRHFD